MDSKSNMDFDCGTLCQDPRKNHKYKWYLANRTNSTKHWPTHLAKEAAIFANTPGITFSFLDRVLKIRRERVATLNRMFPEAKELGKANLLTVTYDDAQRICSRSPKGSPMPFWAIPFYMNDIKLGMPQKLLRATWGARDKTRAKDFLKEHQDELFYHNEQGRRR